MTPEQKANMLRWAQELETTEVKQTQQVLCNLQGEMCCMGIATEMWRKETGKGEWTRAWAGGVKKFKVDTQGFYETQYPTREICDYFGIETTAYGSAAGFPAAAYFAALNDTGRLSFAEIAGTIREKLEEREVPPPDANAI